MSGSGRAATWSACPPGAYDLLAWSVPDRTVGFVRDVRVEAGRRTALTVAMIKGRLVPLARYVSRPTDLRQMTLTHDALGAMPLVLLGDASFAHDDVEPPDPWAVLGPYPPGLLRLRVETEQGEALGVTIPREP